MEERPMRAPGLSTDMEGKELALWLKKAWQGLGDLKVTQGRARVWVSYFSFQYVLCMGGRP